MSGINNLFSGKSLDRTRNPYRPVDPNGQMTYQIDRSNQLADVGMGDYRIGQGELANLSRALGQQAQGKNLVSAEQLRQGLQQGLAAQQSMAAGASPSNQAMAARNAMQNMANLGAGLSGQQALAALQERNAAQQLLSQNDQARMNAGLNLFQGEQGNMYGGLQALEQARSNRFNAMAQAPRPMESILGAGSGAAGAMATIFSDKRLKKDIESGDEDAQAFLKALKAKTYRYKDEGLGEGVRLGIMAQDLEKSKLGKRAVVETPIGKAVDVPALASALAAAAANLDKRVSKVEARG